MSVNVSTEIIIERDRPSIAQFVTDPANDRSWIGGVLGACRELAPSKQESTTYEPSLVCKLLILGCRLLIPDRLLEAKRLDDGPIVVGSRIARVVRFLGRRIQYTLKIVEQEHERRVVMTTDSPFPMMVTYEFEDAGSQTLVRVRVSGQPRGFFRLGGAFLNRMVLGNVTKDLVRLRDRMESPS